jgi:hypothetical protein
MLDGPWAVRSNGVGRGLPLTATLTANRSSSDARHVRGGPLGYPMWLKFYEILLHGRRSAGLIIRWSPALKKNGPGIVNFK